MTSEQEKLILNNKGLVYSVAGKYKHTTLQYNDIVQEGYLGLIYAALHYDPQKNSKFSVYAYKCINGYIKNALYDNKLISIPRKRQEDFNTLQEYIQNYEDKWGYTPTEEEQIKYMGVTQELFDIIKQAGINTCQYAEIAKKDDKKGINDIEDIFQTPVQEYIIHKMEVEEEIKPIYEKIFLLTRKQQQVIILLYGLCGVEEHTIKQVASILDMLPQQVNVIKHQALQNLGRCKNE